MIQNDSSLCRTMDAAASPNFLRTAVLCVACFAAFAGAECTERSSSAAMTFDPMTSTPHRVFQTSVQLDGEDDPGYVSVCTTPQGYRVLSDTMNKKIKVVNCSWNGPPQLISYKRLVKDPWALALFPDGPSNLMATTDSGYHIYYLNVDEQGTVTLQRRMRMRSRYSGIAPGVEPGTMLLSTTTWTKGVEVRRRSNGALIRRIPISDLTLRRPHLISLAGNDVIISDWLLHKVFRVEVATGELVTTYNHSSLLSPHETMTDANGNLYITGYESSNIFVVSPDGEWRELISWHRRRATVHPSGIDVTNDGIVAVWTVASFEASDIVTGYTFA